MAAVEPFTASFCAFLASGSPLTAAPLALVSTTALHLVAPFLTPTKHDKSSRLDARGSTVPFVSSTTCLSISGGRLFPAKLCAAFLIPYRNALNTENSS